MNGAKTCTANTHEHTHTFSHVTTIEYVKSANCILLYIFEPRKSEIQALHPLENAECRTKQCEKTDWPILYNLQLVKSHISHGQEFMIYCSHARGCRVSRSAGAQKERGIKIVKNHENYFFPLLTCCLHEAKMLFLTIRLCFVAWC